MNTTNFQVEKKDFSSGAFETVELEELKDGQVLLEVEKYAFTTNNITYAVFGERLDYWRFFPAKNGYGIIPAWGYAKVVESKSQTAPIGTRFYGYVPMSNYLKVQVGYPTPFSISDASPHRSGLSPIYNTYTRLDKDVSYRQEIEDYIPIIRPLFATSFLAYIYLKEKKFYEADQVFLTSASSKTALGLAFLLKKYQLENGKKVIGLTSTGNIDFVKSTGYYDEVWDYQSYQDHLSDTSSMLVDFTGNADLLEGIIDKIGTNMKHMTLIGFTDWQSGRAIKHPIAEFFFAPDQVQRFFKKVGPEAATKQIANALNDFIEVAKDWIDLTYITQKEDFSDLYTKMVKGEVDPKKGYIIQLASEV